MSELEKLKYQIYKRSKKSDYLTFKQFIENQDVIYTLEELQKRKPKKSKKWLDFTKQKNKK